MADRVGEVSVDVEGRWYRAIGSRIWALFNSLKLTIFVLISLALVSIIGTVIQQNQPVETYLSEYGERWTRIIFLLRLNDMYHSWWFLLLLTLLVLNVVVCTIERFPPKWKALLKENKGTAKPEIIERLSNKDVFTVDAQPAEVKARLLGIFKKRRYRVRTFEEKDGVSIYAWKGISGRFGADVTHVSLLVILLGAIIGNIYGYNDFRIVYEGGSMSVPQADFQLRLDRFWIDYYDTGQIKQYNSLLTVIEDGKEVFKKHIWVNEPLLYKGIRFYQSSYGMAWDRVKEAQVALKRKDREELDPPVTIKWGELKKIPDSEYSVRIVGYVADFAFDERTKTVFSKSADANNPALKVEVYRGDELVSTPWLFFKYPGLFSTIPDSGDDIVFTAFRPTLFSGISINKDPGTNIVWLGTGIMGLGFILAFFVHHRRVWVSVRDARNSSEIRIGGTVNKDRFTFEREFEELLKEIKATLPATGKGEVGR